MSSTSSCSSSVNTALTAAQVNNQIATRIAVKSQNVTKQQGQAVISLLESAAKVQQQSIARANARKGLDITA